VRILALLVAFALCAASALAQQGRNGDRRQQAPQRQMKQEERERMRDDMREAYRQRQGRPERSRQMSEEERNKLRRDIEDANRSMRK
jgi:hypothetical protein